MKNLLLKIEKEHPRLFEIFKFLIVGGFATIIDMLVMAFVLYITNPKLYDHNFLNTVISNAKPANITTIVATGTGFLCGLLFNYIFSIIFVFNNTNTTFAKSKKGFVAFSSLSFVGFLIHTIGMGIGYGILKINEWIIKIFLTLLVLVFNYTTRKKIIFKKRSI